MVTDVSRQRDVRLEVETCRLLNMRLPRSIKNVGDQSASDAAPPPRRMQVAWPICSFAD